MFASLFYNSWLFFFSPSSLRRRRRVKRADDPSQKGEHGGKAGKKGTKEKERYKKKEGRVNERTDIALKRTGEEKGSGSKQGVSMEV